MSLYCDLSKLCEWFDLVLVEPDVMIMGATSVILTHRDGQSRHISTGCEIRAPVRLPRFQFPNINRIQQSPEQTDLRRVARELHTTGLPQPLRKLLISIAYDRQKLATKQYRDGACAVLFFLFLRGVRIPQVMHT